jgi:hypothetical protein
MDDSFFPNYCHSVPYCRSPKKEKYKANDCKSAGINASNSGLTNPTLEYSTESSNLETFIGYTVRTKNRLKNKIK